MAGRSGVPASADAKHLQTALMPVTGPASVWYEGSPAVPESTLTTHTPEPESCSIGFGAPLPLSSIAGDWWLARAATRTLSLMASETVFGKETVPTAEGPLLAAAFAGFSSLPPFFCSFFSAGANFWSANAALRASLAVFLASVSPC